MDISFLDSFPPDFIEAFRTAMMSEVGPSFNMYDPDVIEGKCETRAQKMKVGYVNHPSDPGGETKFGVSQVANPEYNIKELTLHNALDIYYNKYWKTNSCNIVPIPLSIIYFDSLVNHSTKAAVKFLQESINTTPDGIFGPHTAESLSNVAVFDACDIFLDKRKDYYEYLISRNSSLSVFKNGWMNRINFLKNLITTYKL